MCCVIRHSVNAVFPPFLLSLLGHVPSLGVDGLQLHHSWRVSSLFTCAQSQLFINQCPICLQLVNGSKGLSLPLALGYCFSSTCMAWCYASYFEVMGPRYFQLSEIFAHSLKLSWYEQPFSEHVRLLDALFERGEKNWPLFIVVLTPLCAVLQYMLTAYIQSAILCFKLWAVALSWHPSVSRCLPLHKGSFSMYASKEVPALYLLCYSSSIAVGNLLVHDLYECFSHSCK